MTKHGRRPHHVIPLDHGDTREALIHDIGRVLKERDRDQKLLVIVHFFHTH